MARKTNAKQVKNFALQPIRSRPYCNQRIDNRIVAAKPHPPPHFLSPRDGNEVIVQFESRLRGTAVHAGSVSQEVVLQLGVLAAMFRRCPEEFAWHDDGGLSSVFTDFRDRFRVPRTQALSDNLSVFTGRLRHDLESHLRRLFMPVQRALFPEI